MLSRRLQLITFPYSDVEWRCIHVFSHNKNQELSSIPKITDERSISHNDAKPSWEQHILLHHIQTQALSAGVVRRRSICVSFASSASDFDKDFSFGLKSASRGPFFWGALQLYLSQAISCQLFSFMRARAKWSFMETLLLRSTLLSTERNVSFCMWSSPWGTDIRHTDYGLKKRKSYAVSGKTKGVN